MTARTPLPAKGTRSLRRALLPALACLGAVSPSLGAGRDTTEDLARSVIAENPPLPRPRGGRLPIVLWPLRGLDAPGETELAALLRDLDERGFAVPAVWNARRLESSRAAAVKLATLQHRLGLPVVVDATDAMQPFFNGDIRTAHLDAAGAPFFTTSYSDRFKLGCPLALGERRGPIREQVATFVRAYRERGLPLDIVIGDWEIDGPLEWNGAHADALRCQRCRAQIAHLERFADFQATVRRVRADLQKTTFADVVHAAYPAALVGNYGVYPNDGYRYWYDYFEPDVTTPPFKPDQRARYRPWFQEFPLTGYNLAVPVVYTWHRTFDWYDFTSADYRWFYNLLLVGTGAGRSTPAETPLVSFVHWHTTAPPPEAKPVPQFTAENYQELLWHLLLRGHDGFALWCQRPELAKESRLVQAVYAEAFEYREFLERGVPVAFGVPSQPGPVISALKLDARLLVRRTDFDGTAGPVLLEIDGAKVAVPRLERRCQVLPLREPR